MPKWIVLYGQREGSVRTSPRVSINFAKGQYGLFAGSVPTLKVYKDIFQLISIDK